MEKKKADIFWFRRDLRLEDNAGLYHALKSGSQVIPIFIFDTNILNELENKKDKRVDFIRQALVQLQTELRKHHSEIMIFIGTPLASFTILCNNYTIGTVYTNHDYESYAKERDEDLASFLEKNGIELKTYKDQVVFEKSEIVKNDGTPYTIFTPYSKKWKEKLNEFYLSSYPSERYFKNLMVLPQSAIPKLSEIGFETTPYKFEIPDLDTDLIGHYNETRDYPAIKGTSRLSVHLRFGTVSIRKLARIAKATNETWLNELIWRDFYMSILYHFPYVKDSAFKPQYNGIAWRNNEQEFAAWCEGKTGYPIVDAGMRELNETGFMHNRVRMIVASFLTKHLLIDWRWGEAYFAQKLLDYDLSANNGGWQWAAGCGCDAAPYFRIFNPYEQTKKFDKDLKYIRKWVPEFEGFHYPAPIVDHKFARERVLEVYKKALNP